MFKLRFLLPVVSILALSGCESEIEKLPDASPTRVLEAAYVSTEPTSITLLTMVKSDGDFGEHSGLLINGSQRVLYDPAGTFRHSTSPNARDVNYGIYPSLLNYYKSYHARNGYYVVSQELFVPPEMAEELFARAVAQGTTGKLQCGISISMVLNGLEMFDDIPTTYYPGKIMARFGEIPGVITTYVYEDDEGQNYEG